jgi:sugar phosphate permease
MAKQSSFSLALAINERFFYGWLMVAVGFVGLFASGPGQSFTISNFVSPIIEELEISRTSISSAYTLGTLTAAFGLSYLGQLIDRFGARAMLVTVSLLLGISAICFSAVTNIVALYAVFTAVRIFGQGALMLTSHNLVSQWFVRRRGLALSLVNLGFAVGSATYPPLTQILIGGVGWRTAWIWLGMGSWLLVIPIALLFVKSRPEELGLSPDGAAPSQVERPEGEGTATSAPAAGGESWRIGEAIRTRQFWIMGVAVAIPSMLITGMVFHQISYFLEQGLSAQTAASVFTVSAVAMVTAGLFFGFLLDRLPTRYVVSLALLCMLAAMYAMAVADTPLLAYGYGVVFGVASGGMMMMTSYVWPEYFGREFLGSVQGAAFTISIIGASLGPLPFGVAFDLWGSYHRALVLLSLLPAVFAVIVFFTRPPVKPPPGSG